jgi:hypothetical protein
VRWLRNDDEERVLSYERAGAGETLVVVVNLSSQHYAGVVETATGEYREITPAARATASASAAREAERRAATLPAVFLAPWEFRVFSRASPSD